MSSSRWTPDNSVELLENGEAYFPRVFEAIAGAMREVIIETFILSEDKVGEGLRQAMIAAARRGVSVDLMIDGFGSPVLSHDFVASLTDAGVKVRAFDPAAGMFGRHSKMLRRMHRKIVVVDGERAFVGGINYSADHLADFGPKAKQDYAVELRGPVVGQIRRFVLHAIATGGKGHGWYRRRVKAVPEPRSEDGHAEVLFVTRDNRHHTNGIERHYRAAIRTARHRITIANAYFFPGYTLIRELRRAARRGVDVRLILQGEPDMPIVKTAARMLYHHLLHAGVRIFEYCDRPLHGKVALVDDAWSTVGSSNLDPLSLSLNLEANVIVRDRAFNAVLAERLEHLMRHSCTQIERQHLGDWSGWRLVRSFFIFHLMRWYPAWAGWLPRHAPQLKRIEPGELASNGSTRTDVA
jgi:cardiolipin synthase A/B